MKYYKVVIIIVASLFLGCSSKKMIIFNPSFLKGLTTEQSGQLHVTDYIFLKNYRNTKENNKLIDSIALVAGGKDWNIAKYNFKVFTAKKDLSKVDAPTIKANLETYTLQQNNIFNYKFLKGHFREKEVLIDGKIIPSDRQITVENFNGTKTTF